MKLNNFFTRAIFGALYVAVLLSGVLINGTFFSIVFASVTVLALYEYYALIENNTSVEISKPLSIAGGLLLFLSSVLFSANGLTYGFIGFLIYLLALFVSELYLKRQNPIQSIAYSLFGIVYIAVPLSLSTRLVFSESGFHYEYLLALFVFIWLNDSFAYITGMLFGKHRLFERISPKKSWEGFVGGLFFSFLSSFAFHYFFPETSLPVWIGLSIVVVVSGTVGDLFESLIKRTLGVKDSGKMIPGHGGILDRFDSTLFAITAMVGYLAMVDLAK